MVALATLRARAALATALAIGIGGPALAQSGSWPGERLPLPLQVGSPDELALKQEAERHYLLFNLLAGGKYAYDTGNPHEAVRKWERLLKLPALPRDVEKAVVPLLAEARKLAAQTPAPAADASPSEPAVPAATGAPSLEPDHRRELRPSAGTIAGSVSGAAAGGSAATVVWLKRLDGPTPAPKPRRRVVSQKDKLFIPGVVAVPVGSTIDFRNDDDYYHNVFSLSPAAKFDTGLYKQGLSYAKTFTKPGPVELLCNIHATMLGYVYVVDSPYYAQAQSNGSFRIRNVPAGRYELSAWHPSSTSLVRQSVDVSAGGTETVAVRLAGDRSRPAAVPDKYGKPRQLQLGY